MAVRKLDTAGLEREVLSSDVAVVVGFYASWYGPCHMPSPTLDFLCEKYDGRVDFIRVDIDMASRSRSGEPREAAFIPSSLDRCRARCRSFRLLMAAVDVLFAFFSGKTVGESELPFDDVGRVSPESEPRIDESFGRLPLFVSSR